jgi:hypothetical protein
MCTSDALHEVDQAIMVLVEEIGGAEVVNGVPHMDAPNPIDYLEPEEDLQEAEDDVEEEPNWEPLGDDE